MAWSRWTLYDPVADESWTFPMNPSDMSEDPFTVEKPTGYLATTAPDGEPIIFESPGKPKEIGWKGKLLDTATRDLWVYWASKPNQVLLTNDLGEQVWIWIDRFKPARKRVVNRPYKADYDLHAFVVNVP